MKGQAVRRAVECLCCYELVEWLEGEDNKCITELKRFKTVCLVTKMILVQCITIIHNAYCTR